MAPERDQPGHLMQNVKLPAIEGWLRVTADSSIEAKKAATSRLTTDRRADGRSSRRPSRRPLESRAPRAAAAGGGDHGGGTTAGTEAATRPRGRGAAQADAGRPQSSMPRGRPLATTGAGPVAGRRRRAAAAQAAGAVGGTPLRGVAETPRTELEAGSWTSTAGTEPASAAISFQPPPGGGGHRETRGAGDGVAVR